MKKIRVIFLLMFLMGCSSNQTVLPNLIPKTSTPIFIPISTATITPSLSPSTTAIPPTSTPITPVSTLPPEDQEIYLLNLIASNGGCKLPCFLGIQPEVSVWEDIRKIEGPIIFREKYDPAFTHSISLHTTVEKSIENFDIIFWGTDSIIDQITVEATIYQPLSPQAYLPRFAKVMRQYSLPNILSEYGMPSQILLESRGQVEPGAGTLAIILLFYRDLGFVVHYFFTNVVTQDRVTFALHTCLNYDHVELIRLYLQAPDNPVQLEKMIYGGNINSLSDLHPVEEITTLSVDDFYDLFKGEEKTVCFDVP